MEKVSESQQRIEAVALQLFATRGSGIAVDAMLARCFKDAERFVAACAAHREGRPIMAPPPSGPELSNVSVPNCTRGFYRGKTEDYPLNMVSKRFGCLEKTARWHKFLLANPSATTIPELGWSEAEVNDARKVFPHYVG
jgi:hypothetical protein